jgi:hypothetical protein
VFPAVVLHKGYAGNFFPQKLGPMFFLTNNSKIFKNKIEKANNLTLATFLLLGW